jgi:hypothetical protein
VAESGYGSYAQTGHRKRRVKAYLAWVTAQGHMGGSGAGLLSKCHYETLRGFAHRDRSQPTFQGDEGIPVLLDILWSGREILMVPSFRCDRVHVTIYYGTCARFINLR